MFHQFKVGDDRYSRFLLNFRDKSWSFNDNDFRENDKHEEYSNKFSVIKPPPPPPPLGSWGSLIRLGICHRSFEWRNQRDLNKYVNGGEEGVEAS